MADFKNFLETTRKVGLAKDSYFELTFFINNGSIDTRLFSVLCHRASIPGYKITTQTAKIYGLPYYAPVGIEYDPFYCNFYVDNAFTLPNIIYKHRDESLINKSNFSPMYATEQTLMTVALTVFDGGNADPVAQYVMDRAFIDMVQSAPVSWSSHNAFIDMSISIKYEYLYEVMMDFSQTSSIPLPSAYKEPAAVNGTQAKPFGEPEDKSLAGKINGSKVVGLIRNAQKDISGVAQTVNKFRSSVSDVTNAIISPIKGFTGSLGELTNSFTGAYTQLLQAPGQVVGSVTGAVNDVKGMGSQLNSLGNLSVGNFM